MKERGGGCTREVGSGWRGRARQHGARGVRPPPPERDARAREHGNAGAGGGHRRRRGGETEGEGHRRRGRREESEGGPARMGKRRNEETLGTTMKVLTGEEDPRWSREEIRRLPEIRGYNR
jgi:hypothetical protein